MKETFEKQFRKKKSLAESNASERKRKLKRILENVLESKEEIAKAIKKDFGKSEEETYITEILPLTMELRNIIRNLHSWMKPVKIMSPLAFPGAKSKIVYRPKGNVLVISPWNYPFLLAVAPVVSAIAAGNTVILKPSELTPHTASFIKKFFSSMFDSSEVAVFEGDKNVAKELLAMPFDHIFFTGGTFVGRIVMESAARNLSSVTLELGGKSPAFIDDSADLQLAAERIVWGKFLNAGQTCIAPDYVLIRKTKVNEFLDYAKESIRKLWGEDLDSVPPQYCNIVNENNVQRLKFLINDALGKGAKLEFGTPDKDSGTFLYPRILSGVSTESRLMKEEIFGPVLPLLFYENIEEAIGIIEQNPYPLSFYFFGKENLAFERLFKAIPAGGFVLNDTVVHFANTKLPFGGVRFSGLGKGYGYWGFKEFSLETPILKQPKWTAISLMYPPYNALKKKIISMAMKYL
jgi:aldehyde dehydrogenase (NAD+)